jgi:hypothetical protein
MRRFPDAAYLASLLNCGIFERLWRSRVQITADPDRLRSVTVQADNHDVRVLIRSPLPRGPACAICSRLRASFRQPVGQVTRTAVSSFLSEQCSEKCRCDSLPPSSETAALEHREPDRDANGAIEGNSGSRGERRPCGLIDANHRQRGHDHEHIPRLFVDPITTPFPPLINRGEGSL